MITSIRPNLHKYQKSGPSISLYLRSGSQKKNKNKNTASKGDLQLKKKEKLPEGRENPWNPPI